MRGLIVATLVVLSASSADAGKRYYRSYSSCYSRPAYYAPAAVPYAAPRAVGWRAAMTTIIAQQQENQAFNQAMGTLLGAPAGYQGYQTLNGQASGYGQITTQYAPQGQSVYGYNQASSFNNLQVGALYDKAERLTAQAQQLAGQADTDFNDLVQTAATGSARVAEIMARGQAAAAAIAATSAGQPQPLSRTFSFQITQDSSGQVQVVPQGNGQYQAQGGTQYQPQGQPQQPLSRQDIAWDQVLATKCASCHAGDQAKGGLDMGLALERLQAQPAALSDLWGSIVAHVTDPDPAKRMPLLPDGSPGQPLSPQEVQVLQAAAAEVGANGAAAQPQAQPTQPIPEQPPET